MIRKNTTNLLSSKVIQSQRKNFYQSYLIYILYILKKIKNTLTNSVDLLSNLKNSSPIKQEILKNIPNIAKGAFNIYQNTKRK